MHAPINCVYTCVRYCWAKEEKKDAGKMRHVKTSWVGRSSSPFTLRSLSFFFICIFSVCPPNFFEWNSHLRQSRSNSWFIFRLTLRKNFKFTLSARAISKISISPLSFRWKFFGQSRKTIKYCLTLYCAWLSLFEMLSAGVTLNVLK